MRVSRATLLGCALVALAGTEAVHAYTLSAGVRESFITRYDLDFNSDTMNRVKHEVFAQGFSSITATIRMGMHSAADSYVYTPALKSNRFAMESLAARISHAGGRLVLKPLISLEPGLGVANRLTGINPADPALWFSTYAQSLAMSVEVSRLKEVSELVVGTGMHHLWKFEHATSWSNLLHAVRIKAGPRVRLSFELSTDADLAAFEEWKNTSPDSFADVLSRIDLIRIGATPGEEVKGLGWRAQSIRTQLSAKIVRAHAIFADKTLSLANVTIPACRSRAQDEDEFVCTGTPKDADLKYQADGLNAFFMALESLPKELSARLEEVEFLEATTDFEPNPALTDYRFLYYSPLTSEIFLKKKVLVNGVQTLAMAQAEIAGASHSKIAPTKTACVYYDEFDENDYIGPIHARLLQNLLGAFPRWKTDLRPVMDYRAGALGDCDVAFYIASHFYLEPPAAFYADAAAFAHEKNMVWIGFKLEKFAQAFNREAARRGSAKLGFYSPEVVLPLRKPTKEGGDPGFFKYFDYKGETFEKLSTWDPVGNRFMADPALSWIFVTDPVSVEVLATTRHSEIKNLNGAYAVRQRTQKDGGVWFIGDLPFTFVHYEDRYFIFCDLVWDMLGEAEPPGPRKALVRIEDVNPTQNQEALRWTTDFLSARGVPFSFALIPYYSNLFSNAEEEMLSSWKPVNEFPEFVGTLRYAKARGADFVFHGVAHQAGDLVGGFDGKSGDDYEFWLFPQNTPLPQDSSDYVIDMLEKGEEVFNRLGIRPIAWELPHYASSALDSFLFGKLFEWNYHRSIYFKTDVLQSDRLTAKHRMFDCVTAECRRERRELARSLKVSANVKYFGGQIFPYPVWKDSFGQAVIPETLGAVEYPFYNDGTWRPVARPADLLHRAKKFKVIRGAWASFFWHPNLVERKLRYYQLHPGNFESEGGYESLKTLVDGIRALGYEFVSIGDCKYFPRSDCPK